MRKIFFLALYTLCLSASAQQTVLLNGRWLMGEGNLLISQLLTAGRMANIDKTGKPFERRYDETAVQMVLNMLEQVIKKDE